MRLLRALPEFVTNTGILALVAVFVVSISPLQFRIPFHDFLFDKGYFGFNTVELFMLSMSIAFGLVLAADILLNVADRSALGRAMDLVNANRVIFFVMLAASAVAYLAATALTWYSHIPEWVPDYPAILGPPNPSFEEYVLVWKIHPNWLIALNGEHFLHLFITVPLIAANGTILLSFSRGLIESRFHLAGLMSGASLSSLWLFGCCSPYLMLTLGSGLILTVAGLSHALADLGAVVLASNLVLLGHQLASGATRI